LSIIHITLLLVNSICDTNKWLIVDQVTKGMIFSSKCTIKRFLVGFCSDLRSSQCSQIP